ncbi:hypothetical protein [Nocardia sp. NPDC004260]
MSTHSDTDPSTLAKKWAREAERQLHELVNDPPSSQEGRQVALQHVRALQAQAQIYATLEVARQVENVETSMPGPFGL